MTLTACCATKPSVQPVPRDTSRTAAHAPDAKTLLQTASCALMLLLVWPVSLGPILIMALVSAVPTRALSAQQTTHVKSVQMGTTHPMARVRCVHVHLVLLPLSASPALPTSTSTAALVLSAQAVPLGV